METEAPGAEGKAVQTRAGDVALVRSGDFENDPDSDVTQSALLALDPNRFLRVSRSAIVNVDRIKEIQPWAGGDYLAILKGGQQLRISRG